MCAHVFKANRSWKRRNGQSKRQIMLPGCYMENPKNSRQWRERADDKSSKPLDLVGRLCAFDLSMSSSVSHAGCALVSSRPIPKPCLQGCNVV